MSPPSLTPNEDQVRRLLAEATDLDSVALPGLAGVYARFLIAMREARSLAIAREMDRATPPAEIILAFSRAIAAEIFVVSENLGNPGLRQEMVAYIARETEQVAQDCAARRIESTRIMPVRVGTS